ncbi:MAG: hypothetical protein WC869_02175 [Phycisphaerae bacterium]|jgi:hypothetical protein
MANVYDFAVLSVMGPHAGEDAGTIFKRKIDDTRRVGKTFWLVRSYKAKPLMVQNICREAGGKAMRVHCLFIEPSSKGGAIPTKSSSAACEYSADRLKWLSLPRSLGPVTGLMNAGACALVFDKLVLQKHTTVDLWEFADFDDPCTPVVIRQGASTICAVRKDMSSHPDRMKGNVRRLIAVGRLAEPYAVWLK